MDEHLRMHPLSGYADAYQVLCDVADRKGWTVWIRYVDQAGDELPKSSLIRESHHFFQLEVTGTREGGFLVRERGGDLDELAGRLLERVIA